ncbi:hypothetical protein AHMF7616_00432 [Adhaeribacter pallidiroseus]|uniref:Uncharacterized protein n=1 Tax=Adhaeribacter pallidiroseus TaxID=2072847 RepID=A0A369QAA9_9BACT|nr:hypothetical protein AHMF7616_00432 [Adhaeribacter pallidiroseus]
MLNKRQYYGSKCQFYFPILFSKTIHISNFTRIILFNMSTLAQNLKNSFYERKKGWNRYVFTYDKHLRLLSTGL